MRVFWVFSTDSFLVVRKQHTQEIECKATDMAVKDLEIYVKAYERAIMRFNLQPFSNICWK